MYVCIFFHISAKFQYVTLGYVKKLLYLCTRNPYHLNTFCFPMTYTVFITLEPYLAQWLRHEAGGEEPIELKRGSIESDVLAVMLKPQPKDPDYVPQLKPKEGQVEIKLPCFKHIDIRTYNYLTPRAELALHEIIKHRFVVALWKDLYTIGNLSRRIDLCINEWMEEHGIEVDDRNWNTIAKIYQRKRAFYSESKRLSDRKTSKHKKKEPKINPTSEAFCPLEQNS